MPLKLITAPASEPITLAEAKAQCSVSADFTSDDALLSAMIAAARGHAEHLTGRALVTQTWELVLDEFPRIDVSRLGHGREYVSGAIELPRAPLQSVESVKYIDPDGVEQTMDPAAYRVDTDSLVGRVYPVAAWPDTATDRHDSVRIRYVAGWPMSEDAEPVWTGPKEIAQWMLIRVASLYAQRESFVVGTIKYDMGRDFVDGLLDRWVVPEVV